MSGRKILIIGGTGVISSAVLGMLAKSRDTELYVINRGHRPLSVMANHIVCDANDTAAMQKIIGNTVFDAVIDFVVYTPDQARDRVYLFQTIQDNISSSLLSLYSTMKIISFSMKTLYRRIDYQNMEEIRLRVRMYSTKLRRRAFQSLSLDLHRLMALTVSH